MFLWILHISLNFAYFFEFCTFLIILNISHNFASFSELCTFLIILNNFLNFAHFTEFLRHLLSTIKTAPIFKYCTNISKRCTFSYVCKYQLAVHFSKWFHNSFFCFDFTIKETIPFSSLYVVYVLYLVTAKAFYCNIDI